MTYNVHMYEVEDPERFVEGSGASLPAALDDAVKQIKAMKADDHEWSVGRIRLVP